MRVSQYEDTTFPEKYFTEFNTKITDLKKVLAFFIRSGLNFKPDIDIVIKKKNIFSLNMQLSALIDFVHDLLSNYSLPSFVQVSRDSLPGRVTAFEAQLKSFQSRLEGLVDPSRQMYVGSPPSSRYTKLHAFAYNDVCVDYDGRLKKLYDELYDYLNGVDVKTLMQMGDAALNQHQFPRLDSFNGFRSTSSPVWPIPCRERNSSDFSPRTDTSSSPASFFSSPSSSADSDSDVSNCDTKDSNDDTYATQFEMD